MTTEFRRAKLPDELRSLLAFDRKTFPAADVFPEESWRRMHSYWMLVDGRIAGCCAFQRHVDFEQDESGRNRPMEGSLYIASTGVLPRFQGQGLGRLMKCWQIAYAQRNGFTRIVTNTRGKNDHMIHLNERFGFRVVRVTPHYYSRPDDSTVVMELRLGRNRRRAR
jgi:ribosomal protein S18 acetylase RimI-like enzyme